MANDDVDATRSQPPSLANKPVVVSPPSVGETFVDEPEEYAVESEIGAGGMGAVVAAKGHRLGRPVALKFITADREDLRRRFEREALITAKLQHPSIVPVYGRGQRAGLPQKQPDEPFYKTASFQAHVWASNARLACGDDRGAPLDDARSALSEAEGIAKAKQSAVEGTRALAMAHDAVGQALHHAGDLVDARNELQTALDLTVRVARTDTRVAARLPICRRQRMVGELLLDLRDVAEATRLLHEAVGMCDALDDTDSDIRANVAASHGALSRALLASADLDGALEEAKNFVSGSVANASQFPDRIDSAENVMKSEEQLGDVLLSRHDAKAVQHLAAAAAAARKIAAQAPDRRDNAADLARITAKANHP